IDLAPSDFYLFPKLKESLGGHHFNSNDEMNDFVKLFFKKQGTDFYKLGLSKLQNRYKKCIQVQGDYVEK
ncbi:MOS1T transposase, partial [Pseudoatta argentina]